MIKRTQATPMTHWSPRWSADERPEFIRRADGMWRGVCGEWTEERNMSASPDCPTCAAAIAAREADGDATAAAFLAEVR